MQGTEASLAVSGSSGASQSGAFDASGGGNFGGVSYGAGALLLNQPTAQPPAKSYLWITALLVGVVVLAGVVKFFIGRKN